MMYFHDLYPSPYTFKYPKTGEDNSKVCLKIAKVSNGKTKAIDLGSYEYIPRIKFSTKENKLMALTLNRHQNHLKYHWIDVLRSEEHTSELQSRPHLVCRLLLEKKKKK